MNFYKTLRKNLSVTADDKIARIDARLAALEPRFHEAFGSRVPQWAELLDWIERVEFEIATTAANQYSFAKRRWRFTRTLPAITSSGSLLDLGSGLGTDAILLHLATGVRIAGIDMDDLSLRTCAVRIKHYSRWLGFAAEAIQAPRKMNATNLAFGTSEFDFVWSNESIEHIHPPDALFREVGRVLRRGGTLFVLNQNGLSLYEQLKAIKTRGFHIYYPDTDPLNGEPMLIAEERLLTPRACRRYLSKEGFEETHLYLNGVIPSPLAALAPSLDALAQFDGLICRLPFLRTQASDFVLISRKAA
jgi:SAM-dependent methyltransferase